MFIPLNVKIEKHGHVTLTSELIAYPSILVQYLPEDTLRSPPSYHPAKGRELALDQPSTDRKSQVSSTQPSGTKPTSILLDKSCTNPSIAQNYISDQSGSKSKNVQAIQENWTSQSKGPDQAVDANVNASRISEACRVLANNSIRISRTNQSGYYSLNNIEERISVGKSLSSLSCLDDFLETKKDDAKSLSRASITPSTRLLKLNQNGSRLSIEERESRLNSSKAKDLQKEIDNRGVEWVHSMEKFFSRNSRSPSYNQFSEVGDRGESKFVGSTTSLDDFRGEAHFQGAEDWLASNVRETEYHQIMNPMEDDLIQERLREQQQNQPSHRMQYPGQEKGAGMRSDQQAYLTRLPEKTNEIDNKMQPFVKNLNDEYRKYEDTPPSNKAGGQKFQTNKSFEAENDNISRLQLSQSASPSGQTPKAQITHNAGVQVNS